MRIFQFLLLLFVISSCGKDEQDPLPPGTGSSFNATVEVFVYDCPNCMCDGTALPLNGRSVSFYETKDDAIYKVNSLYSTHTNQNGIAKYSGFEEIFLMYVRVEFESGVYIRAESTSKNTKSYHEVPICSDCRYDFGDDLICEKKWNFEEYMIGMINKYHFTIHNGFCTHSKDTLFAEIVEISANGFTLKEYFSNPSNFLEQQYSLVDSVFYSEWIVDDEKVFLNSANGLFDSHLMLADVGKSDSRLNFTPESEITTYNDCKLHYPQVDSNTNYLIEEASINDEDYTDIIGYINVDEVPVDAPIACFIYAKDKGIIKSYVDYLMTGESYGFELID